jgi:hydroxymethylbilane synthase
MEKTNLPEIKKITIGARGSKLSLIQTDIVKEKLQAVLPDTEIVVKVITTKGDKNMSPVPLDSVGKGWFTKEIDKELAEGDIDLAVHSLKDLPEKLADGLIIGAIPEREDAREALVSRNNLSLEQLPSGAKIGTDSTRRKIQILQRRKDVVVESIRGNVNRRLEKLDNGEYDAIFLAVAGLKRLGLTDRITQYFSETDFIPSPGQGALAVVVAEKNTELVDILRKINHQPTITAVEAERALSKAMGGGCKTPIGAYAECKEETIYLSGLVGSLDATHVIKDTMEGNTSNAAAVGEALATKLLTQSKPWYKAGEE